MTKKMIWFVCFTVFMIGTVFAIVFGVQLINKNNQIDNMYTQEQYDGAYDKGVDDTLKTVEGLPVEIESLQKENADYKTQSAVDKVTIGNLQSENTSLKSENDTLQSENATLQNSNDRLNELLEEYRALAENSYIVRFYFNDINVKSTLVKKGYSVDISQAPTAQYMKDTYSVSVGNWKTAEGVSYTTNDVTADTNYYAVNIKSYYDVEFENFGTYTVLENSCIDSIVYNEITETTTEDDVFINDALFRVVYPEKEGYMFEGWSLDGVNVVSIDDIKVTSDLTLKPVYVEATKIEMEGTGFKIFVTDSMPLTTQHNGATTGTDTLVSYWCTDYVPTNLDNVVFSLNIYGEKVYLNDYGEVGKYGCVQRYSLGRDILIGHPNGGNAWITFTLEQSGDKMCVAYRIVSDSDMSFNIAVKDFYELKGE